jgi:hypothetical protein
MGVDYLSAPFEEVRRQVLRRVRYATNAAALRDNRLPPEAPYDAALTNGILAIVADQWPGEEIRPNGNTRAARELLDVIDRHGNPFPYIDTPVLRDGLDLTQPARHGRSDDEFAVLQLHHVDAIIALDQHPALDFLDATSTDDNISDLVWKAFEERASAEVPFDLGDGVALPDPEDCDECGRPTFLPSGWDMFGGTNTGGRCIACGYTRAEDEAIELAVAEAVNRAVERPD